MIAAVLVTVVVTIVAMLLVLNLRGGEAKVEHDIESAYGARDEQFRRVMGNLLGPPIVDGNHVEHLENGDEIFPAMLEAIRGARETITFETFVYWKGEVASEFSAALAERARAGVAVHVLLDWVGRTIDESLVEEMREAGCEVELYHPVKWHQLDRINNRTHRKILVVDGRIGFTGGVGIADEWRGDAEDPEHWRDSHFRVTGPVVGQMQAAFMDNWLRTRPRVLHQEAYFPRLGDEGTLAAQMFLASPREGGDSMRLMYLLAIAAARERIAIGNAYFVPDELTVSALVGARERGVEVSIVVPGRHIDTDLVRRASRGSWGPLLEAGVEIYEFRRTMYHTKIMVVDGHWASVGSTNFDSRSFRLNDEANLNVFDGAFAAELEEVLARDRRGSHRVTLAEWRHRPWRERVVERLASSLRSQL